MRGSIAGGDGVRASDRLEKRGEGQFGVSDEADDQRVIVPHFERLDVYLNDARRAANRRQRPVARRRRVGS